MRVLAKDEWLVAVLLQELFNIFGGRVHLRVHVRGLRVTRIPVDALVMHRTAVNVAEVVRHRQDVGATK